MLLLLVAIAVAVVAESAIGASSQREVRAHIELLMQSDGAVGVRETLEFSNKAKSSTEPFTHVISLASGVHISDIHVAEAGVALSDESVRGRFVSVPGAYVIDELENARRITWHPLRESAVHQFELTYQLTRVTQVYDDGIVLRHTVSRPNQGDKLSDLEVDVYPSVKVAKNAFHGWLDPLGVKATSRYTKSPKPYMRLSARTVRSSQVIRLVVVLPRSAIATTVNARERIGSGARKVVQEEESARQDFAQQTQVGARHHPVAFLLALIGFGIGPALIILVLIEHSVRPRRSNELHSQKPSGLAPPRGATVLSAIAAGGEGAPNTGLAFVVTVLDLVRRGRFGAVPVSVLRWDAVPSDTRVSIADYKLSTGNKRLELSNLETAVVAIVERLQSRGVVTIREIAAAVGVNQASSVANALQNDLDQAERSPQEPAEQQRLRAQWALAACSILSAVVSGLFLLVIDVHSLAARATALSIGVGALLISCTCIGYSIRIFHWYRAAAEERGAVDTWSAFAQRLVAIHDADGAEKFGIASWELAYVFAVALSVDSVLLRAAASILRDRDVSGSALFSDGCAIAGDRATAEFSAEEIAAVFNSRMRDNAPT